MLGVIDDVADRIQTGFRQAGDQVWLLGVTGEHLSGTAWAQVVHDHLGGMPPVPDLDHEQRLARLLVAAAKRRLLNSAHDLADGGLAQALAESCLRHGLSVSFGLPEGDPVVQLFSETPGRVLISLPPANADAVGALSAEHGIPAAHLGKVTDSGKLKIRGHFAVALADLRSAWTSPIPTAMQAAGH